MKVKMITKNECLIYAEGKVYLQSYDTIVACKSIGENPILYKDWDFSRTVMYSKSTSQRKKSSRWQKKGKSLSQINPATYNVNKKIIF